MRRGLDDGRRVAGQDHGAQGPLELGRLRRGRVRLVRRLDATDPGLGGAGHPGPDPGRFERRHGQERGRGLAVRAGDPDDRELVARIAVPPGGGDCERLTRVGYDELWQPDLGKGVVDQRCRGAGGRGGSHELVPIDMETGHGHEQRSPSDRPRIVGHAADGDGRQPGRTDRPAIASGSAQATFARQPVDQPAERRRFAGFGGRKEVGDGPARSSPGHPCESAGQAAGLVPTAVEDPLVGAGELEPLPTERPLVLVEPVQRVAFLRFAAGARDVHATEVHLATALPDRELDRPPTQEVHRPGSLVPVLGIVAGVDRREPITVAVEDQARDRRPADAPRLEVDEVTGRERRAPPGDERFAWAEREVQPLPVCRRRS